MVRAAIVVEENAVGRRVEIVKLAGAYAPREGRDSPGNDEQRERQHDVKRDHGAPRNARVRKEFASTVSELAGMSSAASSGWMMPVTASTPVVML